MSFSYFILLIVTSSVVQMTEVEILKLENIKVWNVIKMFPNLIIVQIMLALLTVQCFCEGISIKISNEIKERNNLLEFEKQEIFTSRLHFWKSDGNSLKNVANQTKINVNDTAQGPQETVNKTHKFVQCLPSMGNYIVQLTNDTELIKLLQPDPKVTDRDIPGLCVLVLFYSKYCPFSSMAAPHYNALPRAFPDIKMVAINAMMYHLFNTQNGIVGVPSLMLFHSGRPVAKFNDSEYTFELFLKFISKHTGIVAAVKSTVTSLDFAGPVTSVPSKESDVFLIISWLFILLCSGYYFTKSRWWMWIIEAIQSNWRESEAHAQHEHIQ